VGGETAEMPAVYAEGDLDVVGFVTGVVDRERMLTGESIVAGDVLYAINSSGLHTNGFSLARKLIFEIGGYAIDARPEELAGKSIADALLAPHTNYISPVRNILDAGIPVKGMAHITGGGLVENVPRILPDGLGVVIDSATWKPQPIFALMQRLGNIDDLEMHRTFNMGVGLVLIGPPGLQGDLAAAIASSPALRVWELGRVEANASGVRFGGVN
jgi:phosphoribosylformylglycinamidine cyclo-ligase